MLRSCAALGHRFVIRAAQDRCLPDAAGPHITGKLLAAVRAQGSVGAFALGLRARPGQAARPAQMQIGAVAVWVRAPQRPGKGPGSRPPVHCHAVRVWEAAPPPGVAALEWLLLSDWPGEHSAQVVAVARAYATRWVIEEFHKALKTGTKAEALQVKTAQSLFAAIALKSRVALRLLDLRERLRRAPEAPAEQAGLNALELALLRERLQRPLNTVRAVALALGRLGGHMNRTGDGMPGWQSLFCGMTHLTTLVTGARLAFKLHQFG